MTKTASILTDQRPEPATQVVTPPSSIDMEQTNSLASSKPQPSTDKVIKRRPVARPQSAISAPRASTSRDTRNFSGDTLVDTKRDKQDPSTTLSRKKKIDSQVTSALDIDWQVGQLADELASDTAAKASTSQSRPKSSSAGKALESLTGAAGKLKSALGKRGRDAVESGREAFGLAAKKRESGRLRASESATPDPALSTADDKESSGRQRPQSDSIADVGVVRYGTRRKRWLGSGLYAGQVDDSDAFHASSSKRALPPPMFHIADQTIDFLLPYDIFAPQTHPDVPKEWRKLSANRFVGDARDVWRQDKLAHSACLCKPEDGCGDGCLNRTMLYECDANNCALMFQECTNRAFHHLGHRLGARSGYKVGLETFKTKDCGYGVRANRSFTPGQIIVEYCGEVITPEECERRLRQDYKDSDCFYIMNFDRGMMIDANKGNIARFVNHACEPNCRMEKRMVEGNPRMALFAGPKGVMTGEELTYDYNFDTFSKQFALDCRCGSELCRGKLDRRDAKRDKETLAASLKRKAADLLSRETTDKPEPTILKKRKTARWSKGWSYVDPEMELLRLQEDALEKGKPVSVAQIEKLQAQDTSRPASLRRVASSKATPGRASDNLRPRPASSAGSTLEKGKSALGRAKDKLARTASVKSRSSTVNPKGKGKAPATSQQSSINSEAPQALERTETAYRLPELHFEYKSASPDLLPRTEPAAPCVVVTTAESEPQAPRRSIECAPSMISDDAEDRATSKESFDVEEGVAMLLAESAEDERGSLAGGVKRSLSDAKKRLANWQKSKRRA